MPDTPVTIDRSQSYEISWEGEPVGDGESSVVASIIPDNLGESKFFPENGDGATSVILTPTILQTIDTAQSGLLVLERLDVENAMEATEAGGLITARYRPSPLNIDIE